MNDFEMLNNRVAQLERALLELNRRVGPAISPALMGPVARVKRIQRLVAESYGRTANELLGVRGRKDKSRHRVFERALALYLSHKATRITWKFTGEQFGISDSCAFSLYQWAEDRMATDKCARALAAEWEEKLGIVGASERQSVGACGDGKNGRDGTND